MDRIGGSERFFRTARTRTHACFSFRISHKRRRCSLQYSVDGYLSELYWFGSFAINPPGTTSPASFPIRFGSRCPSYYPVPAFLFFMCGLSGHSFAGCKGRQNHHQEEICTVDRGPKPLEQTTLVTKRYSLMAVARNHYYYVLSLDATNLSK